MLVFYQTSLAAIVVMLAVVVHVQLDSQHVSQLSTEPIADRDPDRECHDRLDRLGRDRCAQIATPSASIVSSPTVCT